MKKKKYKIKESVWLYPGLSGWHFIYVGQKESKEIKENFGKGSRGFGSIPVAVTIGKTKWDTSIFPSKAEEKYLLPLKALVRAREGIRDGDTVTYTLEIRL